MAYRVLLEVTRGPRWCGLTRTWQQNGEKVEVKSDSYSHFLTQLQVASVHCDKILEGEVPPAPVEPLAKRVTRAITGRCTCPECGRRFKSEQGLKIHGSHSGHKID